MIGSVYASLYASRLTGALPAGLPTTVARTAHESVGAALTLAGRLHSASIHNAASSAFFDGFHTANYVSAGVAFAGALMALALLPAQPTAALGSPAVVGATR